jgi:hypothetical protein
MYTGTQETVNSNQSISGLFNQQGFIGPFDLLDEETIDPFYKRCLGHIPNYLLSNVLFRHAAVRSMAEFAANPAFIQQIIPLLGPDILLWGSQLICQKPKKKKRFHVDAEFSTIDGVAVWLGLRNVVPEKTLFLISGSHRIAASPQEIAELPVPGSERWRGHRKSSKRIESRLPSDSPGYKGRAVCYFSWKVMARSFQQHQSVKVCTQLPVCKAG